MNQLEPTRSIKSNQSNQIKSNQINQIKLKHIRSKFLRDHLFMYRPLTKTGITTLGNRRGQIVKNMESTTSFQKEPSLKKCTQFKKAKFAWAACTPSGGEDNVEQVTRGHTCLGGEVRWKHVSLGFPRQEPGFCPRKFWIFRGPAVLRDLAFQ